MVLLRGFRRRASHSWDWFIGRWLFGLLDGEFGNLAFCRNRRGTCNSPCFDSPESVSGLGTLDWQVLFDCCRCVLAATAGGDEPRDCNSCEAGAGDRYLL